MVGDVPERLTLSGFNWFVVQPIPLPHNVPADVSIFILTPFGETTTPWLINLSGVHKSRMAAIGDTSKSTVWLILVMVLLFG